MKRRERAFGQFPLGIDTETHLHSPRPRDDSPLHKTCSLLLLIVRSQGDRPATGFVFTQDSPLDSGWSINSPRKHRHTLTHYYSSRSVRTVFQGLGFPHLYHHLTVTFSFLSGCFHIFLHLYTCAWINYNHIFKVSCT